MRPSLLPLLLSLAAPPAPPVAAAPPAAAPFVSAQPTRGPEFLTAELAAAAERLDALGPSYVLLAASLDAELPEDATAQARLGPRRVARLLAAQRFARAPNDADVLRLEAALGHPDDRALAARGEALAVTLAAEQAEDGLFGDPGWSMPRRLVRTAEALRALRLATGTPAGEQRAALATLRASRALARSEGTPLDPFTASCLLESRALPAHRVRALRELVRTSLAPDAEGRLQSTPAPDARRADGTAPTALEATARAALALLPDLHDDAGPQLAASVAAAWRAEDAWGDSTTSALALRVVAEGLPGRPTR